MRPRVGLLDIRDVGAYPWNRLRLDAHVEALALAAGGPADAFRAFEPPPCLVVVVDGLLTENTAPYAAWLAAAETLIVVREWDAADDTMADPEMRSFIDELWRTALAGTATVSFVDRREGDPEPLRRALAEARAAAAVAADWKADVARAQTTATLHPGRWLTFHTRWWPLQAGEIAHDERTAYLCDAAGGRFWPLDGSEPIVRREGDPGAPFPDRTAYLVCKRHKEGELRTIDGRTLHAFPTFGWVAIGFDPRWPIAWAGHRMMFYWHRVRDGRAAVLSSAAHDWPCGHAKKPRSDDNYARWVHLAPRADAYLSVFDYDALVSSAVPMRWEVRDGVAVAGRPAPDPLRAVLFTSDENGQRAPWNATPPDEDARGDAPVVVLGASDEVRYAVGLERETYRLHGEALEKLSSGGGGYAIYDAGHRLVRKGNGRLLGGWNGVATLEHEGELFREDLSSGARRPLGRSDRPIAHALPIAGAENVVLVSAEAAVPDERQETTRVRVV